MLTTGLSAVDKSQILLGFDVTSAITFFTPIVFSNITCASLNPLRQRPSLSGLGHKLSSPSPVIGSNGLCLNIRTS